ncbi:MAG: YtxH domain-containing protein [Lactobacillus sp.]|jgi:gas vesicle protein|nr:YtxH domain-containing protein [Lactobacillus sp.]MCI2031784.1 YtxH domain-containing protein [Lactobacillus sp.]
MAKFTTGLLVGAVAGTAYALLTTKHSGPQRQAQISQYLDSLTSATGDVQKAVKRFSQATTALKDEVNTTLKPAVADIQAAATDFEFQTQPHVQQLNDTLERINDATETLAQTPPEL